MKILQVISSFPPAYSYGGPAKMAYEASKYLVKMGHEVTVYTTDVYNSESRLKYKENPMIINGIKVYHFKNISNNLAKKNIPFSPTMALALSKNIMDFDVVHINEYRTLQAKFVQYYAKKYNVPYILQPRGTVPTIYKSTQKKLFDTFFGHNIISDASKIIATSRIESDQYRDVFPELDYEKVVHIPNPIDIETYSTLPKKGEFRKKNSLDNDEKIILFLSRIHERKGADLLIEAFSDISLKFTNVKLVVAGPDEGNLDKLKSIVKRLDIEKQVIFPGPLYEKEKLEAYIDADVFVLPSKDRYESFGNVVLEACACGTPVVVTENCGISEWLGDKVGSVVKFDRMQLSDGLSKILNSESNRECIGKSAKDFAKYFSWSNLIEEYELLYKSAISFGRDVPHSKVKR